MMNQGGVKASIGVNMNPFFWHNARDWWGHGSSDCHQAAASRTPPTGAALCCPAPGQKMMKIREIRPEKEKDAKGIHWLPHL